MEIQRGYKVCICHKLKVESKVRGTILVPISISFPGQKLIILKQKLQRGMKLCDGGRGKRNSRVWLSYKLWRAWLSKELLWCSVGEGRL